MFLFLILYLLINNSISDKCCADCLNNPEFVSGNDSLDFAKCINNVPTNCCYEQDCHMSSITNNFIYSKNVEYNKNTPFVKQGEWVQIQWVNIEYITYILINKNQKKEIQVTNNSILLEYDKEYWFQICIENIGNLYFRGWQDNGCTSSREYNIEIIENDKNKLCGNRPVIQINNEIECNLNRASIIDNTCTCISGYSNPPLCDKEAIWKILAITMTSISAVVSISCLVYTYISNKKKEKLKEYFDFNN